MKHEGHVIKYYRHIFKEAAEFGDLVRKDFPDARTEWAEENGRTFGKRLYATNVCSIDGICYGRQK